MERAIYRQRNHVGRAIHSGEELLHTGVKDFTPQERRHSLASIDTLANDGLISLNQKEFVGSAMALTDIILCAPSEIGSIFEYEGPNSDIFTHALEATCRQLDVLVGYLNGYSEDVIVIERQVLAVRLLTMVASKQKGVSKTEFMKIFEQAMPQVTTNFLTGKFSFDHVLEMYLEQNPDAWTAIQNQIQKTIDTMPVNKLWPRVDSFLSSDDAGKRIQGEAIAEAALVRRGYQPKQLFALNCDWFSSHPRNHIYVQRNYQTMLELEYQQPGITQWLIQNFGIHHFGRYPVETLTDQFNYRDDTSSPWGIIIYPRADHNGSFHQDWHVHDQLRKEFEALGKRTGIHYRIRIAETGSDQLNHQTEQSLQRYGQAAFGILGGHGTQDKIYFGYGDEEHDSLSKEQLSAEQGLNPGILELFQPNAPLLLFSCSTGIENGIAQAMSRNGIAVIGPDADSNPVSVHVHKIKNKLKFDVRYDKAKANRYRNGHLE